MHSSICHLTLIKSSKLPGSGELNNKTNKKKSVVYVFFQTAFFLFFFGLNWIVLLSNNRLRGWSRSSCRTAHTSTLTLFYCFSAVCILQNLYLNLSGAGDGPSCENKKREQAVPLRLMSYESCNSKSTHFRRRKMEQKL